MGLRLRGLEAENKERAEMGCVCVRACVCPLPTSPLKQCQGLGSPQSGS